MWLVEFSIVDAKTDKSVVTFHLPVSVIVDALPVDITYDMVEEWSATMKDLINPLVIGGGLVRRIVRELADTPVSVNASSDVQEMARFVWNVASSVGAKVTKSLGLPTFDESKFVAGTTQVDTTDADVAAFLTAVQSGIEVATLTPDLAPVDYRGEDITTLVAATEAWGKARK